MSSLTMNHENGSAKMTRDNIRQQCLSVRTYFSSHYSAKPEEQEHILDYALELKPNDIIVELGVCNGQTAAMLAQSTAFTGASYNGVDAFLIECTTDPGTPEETTRMGTHQYQYLLDHFDGLNLNGQILFGKTQDIGKLWVYKSAAIKEHIKDHGDGNSSRYFSDPGISLLFIDAGHDEANIKPDIDIWLPLLAPGGIVIFHDYDDPYNPDSPHWAVRHYADLATQSWDPIQKHIFGSMLIARKPV